MTDNTAQVIDAEISLGQVQRAIERGVKEHAISITEWNLRSESVEEALGDLLWLRDRLLKRIEAKGGGA